MIARRAVLAVPVLSVVAAWVALPDALAPHPPDRVAPGEILLPPGSGHLFGTDQLGRDVLSRVIHGARLTVLVSLGAIVLALLLGSLIGVLAGYVGGKLDSVLMRAVDVLLTFPSLLLALGTVAVVGSSPARLSAAVGVSATAAFGRLMRAEVLRIRSLPYIAAAVVSGARTPRVLTRHVLPNAVGPALALAALGLGVAMLEISSLSFLGFGAAPPAADWGSLAAGGRDYVATAWWLTAFPGAAVVVTVLATTALGRAATKRSRIQ